MRRFEHVPLIYIFIIVSLVLFPSRFASAADPIPSGDFSPLSGSKQLTWEGDIASKLVDGVDRFLLDRLEKSAASREKFWQREFSSTENYNKSIDPNRKRLAHILGLRDERVSFDAPELIDTTRRSALVGRGKGYDINAVRWPALDGVYGEGLLLVPTNGKPIASVIALPDADQSPEQIVGLEEGIPFESQFARRFAENGCRVVVPVLIDRRLQSRSLSGKGGPLLSSREFLYRSAFELGRHLIGYEVQKILAAVDWFEKDAGRSDARIGLFGWGEGASLALYAGALDQRIDAVCISGHFDRRESIWQQPIDRNVFGLLSQFGDAELAGMIAPRSFIVEAARGPEVSLPSRGGAPARLETPELKSVRTELERAKKIVASIQPTAPMELIVSKDGSGPYGTDAAIESLLTSLSSQAELAPSGDAPRKLRQEFNTQARHQRQMGEIDDFNQRLLRESHYVREKFMSKLDTSSLDKYEKSVKWYREYFYEHVIGRYDLPVLPPQPCSRQTYKTDKWTGYEVVLDVFPDVIAYGILLLPNDIAPGTKRPVVVCQHGLEGRPQDVIGEAGFHYYKAFAAKLAERGFITFAPQNLYIFKDRFRTLQRKSNPLNKTLFSIIVPQHQQIVDWLKTLPQVDPHRIGFYGLSYGGKTAMRVPPLVSDYALSICSADFNEWVDKNASTRNPNSYVWTGEYEIFEFDLGSTFNYAEMAALVAPRPFMVERGHFDGVAKDHTVGWEFAKVRHLYNARLKIPDRCKIEWFDGPHTINGRGTYDFLHQHLNWPPPKK